MGLRVSKERLSQPCSWQLCRLCGPGKQDIVQPSVLGDAYNKAANEANANGQAYANAHGECRWYSPMMTGFFDKNDCPSGSTGTTVQYIVPENKYSSTISFDDAYAQAWADKNDNGQAYANAKWFLRNKYGGCSIQQFRRV